MSAVVVDMTMYPVEKKIACRVKKGERFQSGHAVVKLRKYAVFNDLATAQSGIDIMWPV